MKVEETTTEVVIDLKSVNLPGWVWIAIAGLVIYLARTYITDSGLVELITIIVYMVIKRLEVSGTDIGIEQVADFFRRAHAEINTWRSRSEAVRSSSTTVTKSVEIKTPDVWQRWMFD